VPYSTHCAGRQGGRGFAIFTPHGSSENKATSVADTPRVTQLQTQKIVSIIKRIKTTLKKSGIHLLLDKKEYELFKILSLKRAQKTIKNLKHRTPIRSSDRLKIEVELASDVTTKRI